MNASASSRVGSPAPPVPSIASVIAELLAATRLLESVRFVLPRFVTTTRLPDEGMRFAAPPAVTSLPSPRGQQHLRAVSLKKPVAGSTAAVTFVPSPFAPASTIVAVEGLSLYFFKL